MSILNYSFSSRKRFADSINKLVSMKQQKMYCEEATYLGEGKVSTNNGKVFEAVQVVDLDLWAGKPVIVSFDESKTRAYILGD